MKNKWKQVNIILAINEFRNIGLASKGWYQLKIQAFLDNKSMNLAYSSNQDLQKEKIEINNNFSLNCQCHSEDQTASQSPQKKSCLQNQNKNAFITLPFLVKYHCQHIKLKSLAFFTLSSTKDLIDLKLTLMKKVSKNFGSLIFQPLRTMSIKINSSNHFLESKEVFILPPECFSLKMLFLSCPIIVYQNLVKHTQQQITQYSENQLSKEKSKSVLYQLRKQVKKQRYDIFILKKQLNTYLKNNDIEPIKLPLHFVSKEQLSMDQVETSQILFFKYLAFYEKYNITLSMLKEQIEHINLDKIRVLKRFIISYEKQKLLTPKIQEKDINKHIKKYKKYIIQTQSYYCPKQILNRYSQNQLKQKKQKIKNLQKCSFFQNQNLPENILQRWSFIEKDQKKDTQQYFKSKYPLIMKDKILLKRFNPACHKNQHSLQFLPSQIIQEKIKKKKRIFIFAHGFQGLPIDLAYLVNMLKFTNQKAKFLILKSFKNNMNQSISSMSQKAVKQIDSFFQKIDFKGIQPQIIFVGHSMGSIILRATFKHLKGLFKYFHTFVSICSPHLGYIQGTKFLTDTGLSLISKIKSIQSLNQLSNRDHTQLEKTFIYKLSVQGSFSHFKRLILIASIQDNYVPWHSARIQPYSQDGSKQKVEKQMISNILGINSISTKLQKIERIQVNFPIEKEKSLNSIIGRTCHIKPLNDKYFLQMFAHCILPE